MRILDTNVMVRLFVRDDDRQVEIAESLVQKPFLVLPTVLIELVWVLAGRYRMPRQQIASKLCEFLGLETATIASETAVGWAIERYKQGADFADMIHVALGNDLNATSFATFDQRIKPRLMDGLALTLETLS